MLPCQKGKKLFPVIIPIYYFRPKKVHIGVDFRCVGNPDGKNVRYPNIRFYDYLAFVYTIYLYSNVQLSSKAGFADIPYRTRLPLRSVQPDFYRLETINAVGNFQGNPVPVIRPVNVLSEKVIEFFNAQNRRH